MSRPPLKVSYLYLSNIIWDSNIKKKELADLLVEKLKLIYTFSKAEEECLRWKIVTILLTQFVRKWNTVSRKKSSFESKYGDF